MTATPPDVKVYVRIDREGWPHGAWDGEPDKAVWIDPTTELDCMIIRNQVGALCGYVGVGPTHPLHSQDYALAWGSDDEDVSPNQLAMQRLEVHGGLTYTNSCQVMPEGGDAEAFEAGAICHTPEAGRSHDVWWFGFDCAHLGDYCPGMPDLSKGMLYRNDSYKTLGYVMEEVGSLARQLGQVA